MIYLSLLIYVHPGKEKEFLAFEAGVLPLLSDFSGKIIQRIRPTKENFIEGEADQPYEIHILSFPDEEKLNQYLKDERRKEFMHLKNVSMRSSLLIKEQK